MILSTLLDSAAPTAVAKEKRIVMICGTIAVAPKDAISFDTLLDLRQLLDREPDGIVCYMVDAEHSRLVEMCDTFEDQFDFQLVLVVGVPECIYSPELEQKGYRLPRASYHSVVNGMREAAHMEDLVNEEKKNSSIYSKEQSGITRKNGNVKELRAFDAPNMSLESSDPETDASSETDELS